mgnify:CR=1 FL=1
MIEFIVYISVIVPFIFIANKKNFLPNYSGESHQKFFNEKKIPLIGGILILPILLTIFLEKNFLFTLIGCLIFLIGFLSDSKILSSPKKRFILQLFVVSLFVFISNLQVTPTRIEFIDRIFENIFLSHLFTIFCLMILINGSNFIDGLNGLLIGYFLIIVIFLYKYNLIDFDLISQKNQIFLIFSFSILLLLNYFNKFYLGDGGSYLLGFILGFILISIYNFEVTTSPYYQVAISPYGIILFLWYPCLENLFSLSRKILSNKSPTSADNNHLHQLIFLYLKYKFKNKKKIVLNVSSSLIINSFNLFIILMSSLGFKHTIYQLSLIFAAVFLYCVIYFLLNKKLKLITSKK